MKWLSIGSIIGIAVLFVLANALFVVKQTEQAIVLQFGEPKQVIQQPGLHVKVPFVQNVEYYDKRLLDFYAETKELIAADQKRLRVDAFVRYHIVDPLRFMQTVGTEATMRSRLNSILESSLRQALGNVPLSSIISEKRADLMEQIQTLVNQQTRGLKKTDKDNNTTSGGFGVEIVDVRIKRADLPPANSEGIYKRMQTERQREANQYRAQGEEDAQKIRSRADKQRAVLIADAQRKAEILRGEGDAIATRIFANSFGQDKDFFEFYRTLQAYKKTLSSDDTTMVLSPDSDFLKYLDKSTQPAR